MSELFRRARRELTFLFHGDCTRKENVVFQVNMLVQVGFKALQRLIQRAIADARILRKRIVIGKRA